MTSVVYSVDIYPCSLIVDKIDVDKDGYVTEKELEDWVRHVANR